MRKEHKLDIKRVGEIVEYPDGRIDMINWVIDTDLACNVETMAESILETFQEELITAAKIAGTYTYQES